MNNGCWKQWLLLNNHWKTPLHLNLTPPNATASSCRIILIANRLINWIVSPHKRSGIYSTRIIKKNKNTRRLLSIIGYSLSNLKLLQNPFSLIVSLKQINFEFYGLFSNLGIEPWKKKEKRKPCLQLTFWLKLNSFDLTLKCLSN